MKDTETLEKIRVKEEESDLTISNNEDIQKRRIAEAKERAEEILEKAKSRAESEYRSILLNSDKRIKTQKDDMEGEHLEHISGIRKITKRDVMRIFESSIKRVFGV